MAAPVDDAGVAVDLGVGDQVGHAVEEVPPPAVGEEADRGGRQHALQQTDADGFRQHPPVVGGRPRNVHEQQDRRVRPLLAQPGGDGDQLVVVHQVDRVGSLGRALQQRVGEVAGEFGEVLHRPVGLGAEGGRGPGVPAVVVGRPEELCGQEVLDHLEGPAVVPQQSDPDVVAGAQADGETVGVLPGGPVVVVGVRAGDPGHVQHARLLRHHVAGAAGRQPGAQLAGVRVGREADGGPLAGQEQLAIRHDWSSRRGVPRAMSSAVASRTSTGARAASSGRLPARSLCRQALRGRQA